jgi:nitrite reductase/ring-hydroxylating ferredoxin subunit
MKGIRIRILIICFIAFFSGCENIETNVPNVPVNIALDLGDYEYIGLQAVGTAITLQSNIPNYPRPGVGGIIVCHTNDGYVAFDQCCTHNPGNIDRVIPQAVQATCPVCGSIFSLWDGTGMPTKGPAKYPLKRYRVTQVGSGIIISN